jgi:hypothetical protein
MGKQFEGITDKHRGFIEAQHIFFVATAARDGRVNLSPKGLESLRVVAPDRVVWVNAVGSGNETAAHLLDTPRMTLMFCSFDAKPQILRLYGTARALHRGDDGWDELLALFPEFVGERNIFDVTVEMVQTSCGFGVPLMDFVADRDTMTTWLVKKGDDGLREYERRHNLVSLDGLPTGLPVAAG